jgi:alpha-amylase
LRKFSFFDIGNSSNYFDEKKNRFYIERISKKSYIPTNRILLDLIQKSDGKFKVSFSITGVLMEQLEKYAPEVIESFKEIVNTGNAELIAETYYHSLAFLASIEEFKRQVELHKRALKRVFNYKPKVFRNTELIYSNEIAKIAESMGYKAVLAEGADHILSGRSPCFLYKAKNSNVRLLLRHYRLSDDVSFRFSRRDWEGFPLTADRYAHWINMNKFNGNIVNLFMDYETFGEHQWEETGIFEFLKAFPFKVLEHGDNFMTPSEIIKSYKPVGELDVPTLVSWADIERDVSAWLGNRMQKEAMRKLYSLEKSILATKDENLIRDWRLLQTADHLYYMCTKWFADGDVHKYFNPYDSPYDAFITFMNIMNDVNFRIQRVLAQRGDKMRKRVIHTFLQDVPEDKMFWCVDGRVFRNLRELAAALKDMSDETFRYHVNDHKNDFSNWIKDVIGDSTLARNLLNVKDRKKAEKLVNKRIISIEKRLQMR